MYLLTPKVKFKAILFNSVNVNTSTTQNLLITVIVVDIVLSKSTVNYANAKPKIKINFFNRVLQVYLFCRHTCFEIRTGMLETDDC